MSDQQVKLISEWYMRPETEVDESKRQYNLGCSDLSMLLLGYIQWVFIFKEPQNFNFSSYLDKLKVSVSQALVHFPPIAGQFVTQMYKGEHSCSMYIDCRKGPGVKLIHAEAIDLSIDDVLSVNSDIPEVVESFFDVGEMELINYDGHTKPLLSVQVTELADGLVMGISSNHCVADGTAFLHFLNKWSALFASSSTTSPSIIMPIYDGTGPIIKLPNVDPNEFIVRAHHSRTRERIFHFSPTSIALLKSKANKEASEGNISSFQALSAFIWRSITRARSLCSNESTTCGLVANIRPRFDPPLPQEYFGNFLMAAKGTAEVGELLDNSLGWAASLLHHAVASLNDKVSLEVCSESVPQLLLPGLRSQGLNPVLVGGSPRFDVYGLEFGLGRPVAVYRGFQHKDGMVSAFPGAKGDGSVDLQVCLAPQSMSSLLSDYDFMNLASSSSYFPQI